MQPNRLESARIKIERAYYRLQRLKHEIKADATAKKYGINFRHESQSDEIVICALMPRALFMSYSVIASEIIGHARSALEHAVWEITPIADRCRRTAFPVFRFEKATDRITGKEGYYDRDAPAMIKGIDAKAAAIIKAAQPFGIDYHIRPLYLLNELWNTDKHRLLNTCASYPDFIAVNHMPMPPSPARFEQQFVRIPTRIK